MIAAGVVAPLGQRVELPWQLVESSDDVEMVCIACGNGERLAAPYTARTVARLGELSQRAVADVQQLPADMASGGTAEKQRQPCNLGGNWRRRAG
jgi:hypothetical protein